MDVKKLVENLKSNSIDAKVFDSEQDAKAYMVSQICGFSVGFGGSVTVEKMELMSALAQNNKVYSHWVERSARMFEQAANAQIYILGVNAIAESGEIVNIDGYGNRVSGAIFGANRKRVYYVCGTNKICKDLESALWRAKNIAAPLNAKRLNRKTPCAIKGDKCYNCKSAERICNATSIVVRPTCCPISVILIDETLGL